MSDAKDANTFEQLRTELKAKNAGWTAKEVESQEALVSALKDQVGIEQIGAQLKQQNDSNAKGDTSRQMSAQAAGEARTAAEGALRRGEMVIAADKATATARLDIAHADIASRLAVALEFAGREEQAQLEGNAAQIAALDKLSKDYPAQLKALKDKALDIEQEHSTQVTELTAKASEDTAAKTLADLQSSERERLEATKQGSAARLAALDADIREEQSKQLEDTAFYRDLLQQRVDTARAMAEEAAKQAQESGDEAASHDAAMATLGVAAEKQRNALINSARKSTDEQIAAQDKAIADEEYQIKRTALAREIAALDKSGQEYNNKLKALQDKEKQLTQAHENEITQIGEKAQQDRNKRMLAAQQNFDDSIARGLTQVLMGHESFAKMMNQLGNQVVSGMMENAIKSMLADDMTKEKDAAKAARKAYGIGVSIGGPAGMILGPVFGATAYAAQMAFAQGGIVPGVGGVDSVPSM